MAIQGLPTFTLPGEELAKAPEEVQTILSKILEGRQGQQKLAQEALANEQLNKYRMSELDLKKKLLPMQLEALKAKILNAKQLSGLTQANVTRNQAIIQNIDNVIPLINSLSESDVPGQIIGKYLNPNKQASYEATTSAIIDSLVSALGLPKTNESIHLASNLVKQKPMESKEAFKVRLNSLIDDLKSRKIKAMSSLQSGIASNNDASSDEGDSLGLES